MRLPHSQDFEARLNRPSNKDTSIMRGFVLSLLGSAGSIGQGTVLVVVHGSEKRRGRPLEKAIGPFGKI
jgi:hypothetical protein